MSDLDQGSGKLDTESGLKLYTRLLWKKRPSIVNLLPEILPNDGPKPGEIIEICGDSCTGKTMHLMDLIAQVVAPAEYGGKGATAIVVDTNSNFNVHLHMPQVIAKHIIHHRSVMCLSTDTEVLQNDTDVQNVDAIVFEAMRKIQFFKCYSGDEYELTMLYCKNFLTTNSNVSLLAVDAISTFYWSDLNDREPHLRMDTYLQRKVQELRYLVDEHQMVAVYTRSMDFGRFTPTKEDHIDYKIHLKHLKDQSEQSESRIAHSYCPSTQMSRKFSINEFGIQWKSSKRS